MVLFNKKCSVIYAGLIASLVATTGLLGCQTNELNGANNITMNHVGDIRSWSASTPKPRLLQTITKYEWQLTHVTNEKGQIQDFNHQPPLIMTVRPEVLLFKEGCHRYQGSFGVWRPSPYPYSLPEMSDLPDNCEKATNSSNHNFNEGDIQRALEIVFAPYSGSYFRFDPILPPASLFSKKASKQLALTTDKGKIFIFSGTAKPEKQITGLPITNELLERYQWHLTSATDNTNKSISQLNHPDVPITASFRLDSHNQGVGFLTGCNGVGGSYALSTNQTLLIGISPSTLMGCGNLINSVEDYLDRIMHNSTSQLHLSLQPLNQEKTDFPLYNLLQTMETGETLVWENEEKD